MKKNAFVLIETIIVLVVVLVSMLSLYKSYSFIIGAMKQNKYYDNINDVYKINILKKTFVNGYPTNTYIKLLKASCTTKMSDDCTNLYDIFGLDYIIYNKVNMSTVLAGAHSDLSNSDINYMKLLEDKHKYLIIHYQKNSKDYYASISVGLIP